MKKQKIILKGIPASPGRSYGKVRIIKSSKDMNKLNGDEIIVTSFLSPDFVAILRENPCVCGVITNEGGATCHAAIIAREFKIPYIAGTVNATKKLKPNTFIKMDAETGLIYEKI